MEMNLSDVLPENIKNAANQARNSLVPVKSKTRYEKAYHAFKNWQRENDVSLVNEDVLLAYFQQLSKNHSPSSLWVYYSMLRSLLSINENIDIKGFYKLQAFIKRQNVGNKAKKAKVLSDEEFKKFLVKANDEKYLLAKVVAIFGLYGACRCDEIYGLTINDVKQEGSVLIVTIKETKNYKPRFFTVTSNDAINAVQTVKKHMDLRPKHAKHEYFFVFYKDGKCSVQRVGIHKIASIPKMIATFLGLPNVEQYTGHSLRRSSATILANTGASTTDLKRLGGWKSTNIVETYVEESVENKIKMAKRMFGSTSSSAVSATFSPAVMSGTSEGTSTSEASALSTEIIYNNEHAPSHMDASTISNLNLPGIAISSLQNCTINIYYDSVRKQL